MDTSTQAGRFQTHTMAGVAELERNFISERTRSALAAKKVVGARLGRPSTLPEELVREIVDARAAGSSINGIARDLTERGEPTARGGVEVVCVDSQGGPRRAGCRRSRHSVTV